MDKNHRIFLKGNIPPFFSSVLNIGHNYKLFLQLNKKTIFLNLFALENHSYVYFDTEFPPSSIKYNQHSLCGIICTRQLPNSSHPGLRGLPPETLKAEIRKTVSAYKLVMAAPLTPEPLGYEWISSSQRCEYRQIRQRWVGWGPVLVCIEDARIFHAFVLRAFLLVWLIFFSVFKFFTKLSLYKFLLIKKVITLSEFLFFIVFLSENDLDKPDFFWGLSTIKYYQEC